jgi:hypothetical protein
MIDGDGSVDDMAMVVDDWMIDDDGDGGGDGGDANFT